jgi:hypothetical protein
MLFLETNTLNHAVSGTARLSLLRALQDQELRPLIRSARLHAFALALGTDRVAEMETTLADWTQSVAKEPYTCGDVFCLQDHLLFLVFEENLVRAGIIYESRTPEPFRKLEAFCSTVRQSLHSAGNSASELPQWKSGQMTVPKGFRSFITRQDSDSLYTNMRKEATARRILAASNLEDEGARVFLRTARDAHAEGYAAKLLTGQTAPYEIPIEKLENVGLVVREVQVSCRKTGHALFRLPNAHALAVVTVSDATCSECGAAVADESVQEVVAPTKLASSLLEDGSWLVSRLHYLLRELGVPEREIALGPSEGTGYGQMMANICGEPFLLVTRDGDLTPAFARWAIDLELETEACHLVIVATGRVHREAGVLLQNHARRRISSGQDFEMILADDVFTAGKEIKDALERVSQRVVADQLCVLDNTFGVNLSQLVLTRFRLARTVDEDESPLVEVEREMVYEPTESMALTAHAAATSGGILELHSVDEFSEAELVNQAENVTEFNSNVNNVWESQP